MSPRGVYILLNLHYKVASSYVLIACENSRFSSLFTAGDVFFHLAKCPPAAISEEKRLFSQANVLINVPLSVIQFCQLQVSAPHERSITLLKKKNKNKNRGHVLFFKLAQFFLVDNQQSAQHNEQHTGVQYVRYIYFNLLAEKTISFLG